MASTSLQFLRPAAASNLHLDKGNRLEHSVSHSRVSALAASCNLAGHEDLPKGLKATLRIKCRPTSAAALCSVGQHSLALFAPSIALTLPGRRRLAHVPEAVSGTGGELGGPEQPEASTSDSDHASASGQVVDDSEKTGLLISLKRRLAALAGTRDMLLGEEPVRNYGFLGELLASFKVFIAMGPINALGLVLLQAFLWFLQEMLQVATVKMIRLLDPPALVIVNKLSLYIAIAFLFVNMTYLALATGLSVTAVTQTVAATFSKRRVSFKDTFREWRKNWRHLAVAQLRVYWPLLLVVVFAGLEGDRFLDDTRTQQLEMIQEMKILQRINPLTLIALYPGLRLLRIASWFSYFFYTLTVVPLLGVAAPAIVLENITAKQAIAQRRFVHLKQPRFSRFRLLPLLTPVAVMLYFTFFTKAPLPINAMTVFEWSHQVRARLGKAAWLVVASLIQVLLYISYRKVKEGEAFNSEQLGAHVEGKEQRGENDGDRGDVVLGAEMQTSENESQIPTLRDGAESSGDIGVQ